MARSGQFGFHLPHKQVQSPPCILLFYIGCAMRCPFCGEQDTKVIDSRLVTEGDQVRRRRQCQACEERFTTFESAELVMPKLIKSNGTRVPFDEEKLTSGIQRALEKRPVSVEDVEASIHRIQATLRATGEREVKSLMVGELVMEELRKLDQVAYVRFASVYRQFQDIEEFSQEIDRIRHDASGETFDLESPPEAEA